MTERTFNIIMACKHRSENTANVVDGVKAYMSDECDCPIHHYSECKVSEIMLTAMYDYIDTCDKPSTFLRTLNDVYGKDRLSLGEQIARAFALVRVRNDHGFVNGFGEWIYPECKYKREDGICRIGASSTGRCEVAGICEHHCSHYQSKYT